MNPARLILVLTIAIIESAPLALLLELIGAESHWPLLVLLTMIGAGVDRLAERVKPSWLDRLVLLAGGLLIMAWGAKALIGAGLSPFSGWGQFGAALGPGSERPILAYLAFLPPLLLFWRGTRLPGHDARGLQRLFAINSALLLLIVLTGIFTVAESMQAQVVPLLLLVYVSAGLIAQSLAHAAELADGQLRHLSWRGALSLSVGVLLVLGVGLGLASLVSPAAGMVVQAIFGVIGAALTVLASPLFIVGGWMARRYYEAMARISPDPEADLQEYQGFDEGQDLSNVEPNPWAEPIVSLLVVLPAIALIVVLMLIVMRRRRSYGLLDEERESLLTWGALLSDARGLLGNLAGLFSRPRSALELALQRLGSGDPNSRVRRAYIRLLLELERRGLHRAAAQTPAEFAPLAGTQAGQRATQLTSFYERARYHPAGVNEAAAQSAEQLAEE